MKRFLERHRDRITGTLSGFDRMLFRGSLRSITYVKGLEIFLYSQHVLMKDFGSYVIRLSKRLVEHAKQLASAAGDLMFICLRRKLRKRNWRCRLRNVTALSKG